MKTILVRNFDDGVTLFTINRPERRNAISAETALELQQAFAVFDQSESQQVAVITSTGNDAFTAGADVDSIPELWRCLPSIGIATQKPIIAAISGWCVGGGVSLAMMCDLAVAARTRNLATPRAAWGSRKA